MANTKITITFDSEKLVAIKQFAEDGAPNIDALLQEQLEKVYVKVVPISVRKYLEGKAKPMAAAKSKSATPPDIAT